MAKEKAIIHCCIERETHELLMEHCRQTGQTKTTAIKRAIKAYCEAGGRPSAASKPACTGGTENGDPG